MTEDDTFRTLRRIPYADMHRLADAKWQELEAGRAPVHCKDIMNTLFKDNGWTQTEYIAAWNRDIYGVHN